MTTLTTTNVVFAFDLLLDTISEELLDWNQVGAQAFTRGDYAEVDQIRAGVVTINNFRQRIEMLREEWQAAVSLLPLTNELVDAEDRSDSQDDDATTGATPMKAYMIPVLQALVQLGGSARSVEVQMAVETIMRNRLTAADYVPQPNDHMLPKWRNNTRFARSALVKQGLMVKQSRGWWMISEAGRAHLQARQGDVE